MGVSVEVQDSVFVPTHGSDGAKYIYRTITGGFTARPDASRLLWACTTTCSYQLQRRARNDPTGKRRTHYILIQRSSKYVS